MKRQCYPYIRWSLERQSDGTSYERQSGLVADFCRHHNLEAMPELIDSGVASFRGRNVHNGNLGKFLAKVQAGEIPRGSVLLVESTDRLTRMKLANGLQLVLDLHKAGISLGLAQTKELYGPDEAATQVVGWVRILVELERGHGESKRKRELGQGAWNSKIEGMKAGTIATSKGPEWLRAEAGQWTVIEEKAKPIRRLFELALVMGVAAATRQVNEEFGLGWKLYQSQYLLKNRKLIGEHSPRRTNEDGKKEPGEPIPGYYPIVVDPVVFDRVALQISQRKPFKDGGGGKVDGKKLNFLRGLITCAFCGSTVRYMNKGGKEYFMCTASMTNKCRLPGTQSVRAEKIRREFLNLDQHTAVREFMAASAETVGRLERERLALVGKLQPLIKRQEELDAKALNPDENLDAVLRLQTLVAGQITQLNQQIATLETQKAEAAAIAGATLPHDRIEWLISDGSPEAIAERGRLNIHLKQMFKHIRINWRERVLWFKPRETTGFRPDFPLPF